jgi:hypothetical protein
MLHHLLFHSIFHDGPLSSEDGPLVLIQCPICGLDSQVLTYNQMRPFYILGATIRFRTSWALCGRCGELFTCKRNVHELAGKPKEELGRLMKPYGNPVGRVLALTALMGFGMPAVGLLFCLLAVVLCRRSRGWRTASRVAFASAVVFHLLLLIVLVALWG